MFVFTSGSTVPNSGMVISYNFCCKPATPWKIICSGSILISGFLQSSTQIVTYTTVLRCAQITGGINGLKQRISYQ